MKQWVAMVLFWILDRRGLRQCALELVSWMAMGWLLLGLLFLFGLLCRWVLDLVGK